MKKDLTKLTQDMEELEKRIKAISTSYTTLAQIIAVRDSLDQLKTCFNELTTAIKEDDDDASLEQLNALANRVLVAETDITTLQTDLSSTQEDLTTLQTDLSSTNSIVGEHSTTLTNLQATQTSLQSAQTNMQTTISNQTNTLSTHTTDITSLKSRMTTAEANIGALTNGIDVGTLEDRITALEGKKIYITEINIRKDVDYNYINNVYFRLVSSVKINSMEQAIKNIGLINRHATGYILGNPVIAIHRQSDTQIGIIYSIPYETGKYNNATSVIIDITNTDWKFFLNSIEI